MEHLLYLLKFKKKKKWSLDNGMVVVMRFIFLSGFCVIFFFLTFAKTQTIKKA